MGSVEKSYIHVLEELKTKIKSAQVKAALAVNSHLITLYWEIGKTILERQEKEGWGAKVIENLSNDLRSAFPDMKGLSERNLKYMRKFAQTYSDFELVQQVVAQLPWGHNVFLLDKVSEEVQRTWYAQKAIENGWSRNVMVIQIESNLYQRQALEEKTTNFALTLPQPQSDLAHELLKDPYNFDFLALTESAQERDIENALVKHITKFLLELGKGFAFIGQQYHLEVSNQDFYIDLLFYHIKLKCYVVIELKSGEFKPEYAGKLNFYLSAVDDIVKDKADNPSIGILLCKTKDKVIAEYSLKDITKPVGISEYKLIESIPEQLKSTLPTIEELEKGLDR